MTRTWLRILVFAVFTAPLCGWTAEGSDWDDEPNELSWEHFSTCLDCFRDFAAWAGRNSEPWTEALAAAQRAGLVGEPPKELAGVWLEAEAFPLRGATWAKVEREKMSGRPVSDGGLLRGRYGHNASFVRTGVVVRRAGWYRVWTRYWHLKGHHASFRVRILPAQMKDYSFRWQATCQGDWLNYRFDFAEHGRKQPVLSRKARPTGFVWESAPMVKLPAGEVCVEIAGCIHGGPYTYRHVDCLVLSEDPLWQPNLARDGGGDSRGPCAETKQNWGLWKLRSGAAPLASVPSAVQEVWRSWRADLLGRLADGDTPSLHLKRLARGVYFDKEWNLIGTPAQVQKEIERLRGTGRQKTSWYQIVEAEAMDEKVAGWTVESHSVSGGGKRVKAHYCDGLAELAGTVIVPQAGQFRLWVHHSRIKGYANLFEVRLHTEGQPAFKARFGEEPVDAGGYRMVWTSADVQLTAGEHRLVLWKNRGKGPYAYRHVDRIVLTDDLAWQPVRLREPPLARVEIEAWVSGRPRASSSRLVVWQPADVWRGFDMDSTRPGAEDTVAPESVVVRLSKGEVGSALLHLANPSTEAAVVAPRVTGPAAGACSSRVVAYVLSKPFGWQPMPLLRRREVTVQPGRMTSLWLTADARELPPGQHEAVLTIGQQEVKLVLDVERTDLTRAPVPLVGGWCWPYAFRDAWRAFADVGLNLVHGAVVPKHEMQSLGLRLCNVVLGIPKADADVHRVVAGMKAMGLDYADWSWELFDEPSDKTAGKWADGAKAIRRADPRVQIWCNPCDAHVCRTPAVETMAPFMDVACPYINHFRGWPDGEHARAARSAGRIKLFYTTPCGREKAPHAPFDMLHLGRESLRLQRDGWDFFCLKNYYGYANTPWDDVHAYHTHQAVSIYPGAWSRAVSTRNLEALREAVRCWRRARVGQRD